MSPKKQAYENLATSIIEKFNLDDYSSPQMEKKQNNEIFKSISMFNSPNEVNTIFRFATLVKKTFRYSIHIELV